MRSEPVRETGLEQLRRMPKALEIQGFGLFCVSFSEIRVSCQNKPSIRADSVYSTTTKYSREDDHIISSQMISSLCYLSLS